MEKRVIPEGDLSAEARRAKVEGYPGPIGPNIAGHGPGLFLTRFNIATQTRNPAAPLNGSRLGAAAPLGRDDDCD